MPWVDKMQKRIILIACAIFSISILLTHNNIEKAYGLVSYTLTYDDNCNSDAIEFVASSYILLCTNGEIGVINAVTHATLEANLIAPKTNFIYNNFQCTSITACKVVEISTGIDNDNEYIISFNPTNGVVSSNVTIDMSGDLKNMAQNFADVNGGWFPVICDDNDYILINDALTRTGDCAGNNFGNLALINSVTVNPEDTTKIAVASSLATNSFRIWVAGGAQVCQLNFASSGNVARNTDLDEWIVKLGNVLWRVTDACVGTATITHSLAGSVRHVEINNSRNELYVVDNANVQVLNSTTTSYAKLYRLDTIDDSNAVSRGAVGINDYAINFPAGGAGQFKIQLWELDEVADTPVASTVCIDTNLDGVTDLCFDDTNADGVADNGLAGSLGAYRGNANITKFGFEMNCAFGIGSCTNADAKTNGVGLMYLGLIVIGSYSALVGIHIQAQKIFNKGNVVLKDALNINPTLLLVMLVIDVGLTWYMGWVANEIFYTLILLIAVGCGFRIYKEVKGGNSE